MLTGTDLRTPLMVQIGEWTNRTLVLPIVVFFPTSRCNSRCVSCDWWKSDGAGDLSLAEIGELAAALPALGTRVVLFSGGEPLLRPDVFAAADQFRRHGIALHLHTSGLNLERAAPDVARTFSRVMVSLDAPTEKLYRAVRGVAALTVLERGVARLRQLAPETPVIARTTVHRYNYRELPRLVEHARAMSLDGISFLPADLSASAFGRAEAPVFSLGLGASEVGELADIIEAMVGDLADDFASGFIRESAEKLRRLPQYYAALAGFGEFPPVDCNAPHTSVVIEADGQVRPCFFHAVIGSVRRQPLSAIVTSQLPEFRRHWSTQHPTCRRCVCSLRTTWRSAPWH